MKPPTQWPNYSHRSHKNIVIHGTLVAERYNRLGVCYCNDVTVALEGKILVTGASAPEYVR